jgi:transposase
VRRTGSLAPAQIGGHRRPLLTGQEDLLRQLTAARPGITLAELRTALTEHGISVGSLTTIWSTLHRLGLRHKKRGDFILAVPEGRSIMRPIGGPHVRSQPSPLP